MFKPIAFLYLIVFVLTISAGDIRPLFRLATGAMVTDFAVDDDRIYIGTDAGTVEIFDLRTQTPLKRIFLDPVRSGTGEPMAARIQSIDVLEGVLLIVSSAENAYRNVWKYDEHGLVKLIGGEEKRVIKAARFVDRNRFVMGTFGAEIVLHDLNEGYDFYTKQASGSTLGGFALSADRRKLVVSDESGAVRQIDVETGKVEKIVGRKNLDNVFQIAEAAGVVVTAGQDRRVVVYRKDRSPYHLRSDFLVYAVGISPDGKTAVYSSGEDNDLQLFETESGRKLDRLVGHRALVNKIVFFRDRYIISAGNEEAVLFWKWKK